MKITSLKLNTTGLTNKSFTLIESLIVVTLLSIIGLSVFTAFSNGLKIWERSHRAVVEEDVAIFFERLTQDLANAFEFSLIKFEGSEIKLKFATIVTTEADRKLGANKTMRQIGHVQYYYDEDKKEIYRAQGNYSLAIKDKFFPSRVLMKGVESFNFSFFYFESGQIKETKSGDLLPAGVKVTLGFLDKKGREKNMVHYVDTVLGI